MICRSLRDDDVHLGCDGIRLRRPPTPPSPLGLGTAAKAAGSSVACTIPASTVEGDLLITVVGAKGTNVSAASSAGWTVHDDGDLFTFVLYVVLTRWATSDDEAAAGVGTYTFAVDGSPTATGAAMVAVGGVRVADPLGAVAGSIVNGTSLAIPSVTSDGYSRALLAFAVVNANSTITWPGGYAEIAETVGATALQVGMSFILLPTPAASGSTTVTIGASAAIMGGQFYIRPA